MPEPTLPCLLDKNVVRHALQALVKLDLGKLQASDDLTPLEVLRAVREGRARAAVSPELSHLLRRHNQQIHVQTV
jgi:hypothetical protein